MISPIPSQSIVYFINSGLNQYLLQHFTSDVGGTFCGLWNYTFVNNSNNQTVSSSLVSTQKFNSTHFYLVVNSSDQSLDGKLDKITVWGQQGYYTSKNFTNLTLSFQIDCSYDTFTDAPQNQTYLYKLGSQASFQAGNFTSFLKKCNTSITYSYIDTQGIISSNPSSQLYQVLSSQQPNSNNFTIQTSTMTSNPLVVIVQAEMLGVLKAYMQVSLDVFVPCNESVYQLPTNQSVVYAINNTRNQYVFNIFKSSWPLLLCGNFSYFLTNVDGSLTQDQAFYLDSNSSNIILSVYSNDSTLIGQTQSLLINGYQGNQTQLAKSFRVDINFQYDCKYDQIAVQNQSLTYILGTEMNISLDVFTSSIMQCSNYTYLLYDENLNLCSQPSSLCFQSLKHLSSSGKAFSLNSQDTSISNMIIIAQAINPSEILSESCCYNITISKNCSYTQILPSKVNDINYVIGRSRLIANVEPFSQSIPDCFPLSYTLKINGVLNAGFKSITLNTSQSCLSIEIESQDLKDGGLYRIELIATEPSFGNQGSSFFLITLIATNSAPPYFQPQLSPISLTSPSSYSYQIPSIYDNDKDPYTMEIDLGLASQFVSLQDNKLVIDSPVGLTGSFKIKFNLTDLNEFPLSAIYELDIDIKPNKSKSILKDSDGNSSGYYLGKILIDKSIKKTLTFYIASFDFKGKMEIAFSKPLYELDDELKRLCRQEDCLSLSIDSDSPGSGTQISDWQIQDVDQANMKLKVMFKDPNLISINVTVFPQQMQDFNTIQMKIDIPYYFVSSDLDSMANPNNESDHVIPTQQLNSSAYIKLEAFTQKTVTVISSSMYINIFLAIVLGVSLKQLWMLMNTLQIITHMPLLNIPFPSSFIVFTETLKSISNMDIIPNEYIEFLKDKILSQGLYEIRAGGSQESLGLLFLLIPFSIIFSLLLIALILLTKRLARQDLDLLTKTGLEQGTFF